MFPFTRLTRGGFIVAVLAGLLIYSRDPLFISLLVGVGFGMVLTGVSYMSERRTFWGAMLFMATWELLYWAVHVGMFALFADVEKVVNSTGNPEEEIR